MSRPTTSPARGIQGGYIRLVVIAEMCIRDRGAKLTVKGLKAGTTRASITSSKGETHNFNITVRKLSLIHICQIFSGNTVSNSLATVRAIKYAADNGAVILQCSWGYVRCV